MAKELGRPKENLSPLLSLVWKLQQTAEEVLQAKGGVGLSQARIMAALDKSVPRSQRQVASWLGQTEANISRQLRVMKKQGLVTVTRNKKDKRQRDVSLTPKGYRTYTKCEQILKHHEKGLLSSMSRSESRDFEDKVLNILNLL